jgi:hypothetical protein
MTTTVFTSEARELDARTAEGIDVHLLWHPATDTVSVAVFDSTNEEAFELVVDSAEALDAFHHPFAYAAFRGVAFEAPARAWDEPVAALEHS